LLVKDVVGLPGTAQQKALEERARYLAHHKVMYLGSTHIFRDTYEEITHKKQRVVHN
jgi:hypothetical protein